MYTYLHEADPTCSDDESEAPACGGTGATTTGLKYTRGHFPEKQNKNAGSFGFVHTQCPCVEVTDHEHGAELQRVFRDVSEFFLRGVIPLPDARATNTYIPAHVGVLESKLLRAFIVHHAADQAARLRHGTFGKAKRCSSNAGAK